MINFRGDFKAVGHVLKDSWQRKNHEEKNSPRHFAHPCENFAGYAKPFSNSKCHPVPLLWCHPVPLFWFHPLFTRLLSHLILPFFSHSTPPFEHGPEGPLLSLRRVALRGREPPMLGCLVIFHLRRPPQRPRKFPFLKVERLLVHSLLLLNTSMRLGDLLLHKGRLLHTLRVQCGALLPRGPGFQAQASHPELHSLSLLLLHMLELLHIMSFLPTCHRGLILDARCSQHCPLRAT